MVLEWALVAPAWILAPSEWTLVAPEWVLMALEWILVPPEWTGGTRLDSADQWTLVPPESILVPSEWILPPRWVLALGGWLDSRPLCQWANFFDTVGHFVFGSLQTIAHVATEENRELAARTRTAIRIARERLEEAIGNSTQNLTQEIRKGTDELSAEIQNSTQFVFEQFIGLNGLITDKAAEAEANNAERYVNMSSRVSNISDNLEDFSNRNALRLEVITGMLTAHSVRLDELQDAVMANSKQAERHNIENIAMQVYLALSRIQSASVDLLGPLDQQENARDALRKANAAFGTCQCSLSSLQERRIEYENATRNLASVDLLSVRQRAREAFLDISMLVSQTDMLQRVVEQAVIGVSPDRIKDLLSSVAAAGHSCEAAFSPDAVQGLFRIIQEVVETTLSEYTTLLENAYETTRLIHQILIRFGAPLNVKSDKRMRDAWMQIVDTVHRLLEGFLKPINDPSLRLVNVFALMLQSTLPEVCKVPRACVDSILREWPDAKTNQFVLWSAPDSDLKVVFQKPERLLYTCRSDTSQKHCESSGWVVDLRHELPPGFDQSIPRNLFVCAPDNSTDTGYRVHRTFEADAKAVDADAFCLCSAVVEVDKHGDPSVGRCKSRTDQTDHDIVCQDASLDHAIDVWSPANTPMVFPSMKRWSNYLQSLHGGTCGDGVLQRWEACDEGLAQDGNGCSISCDRISSGYRCSSPGSQCSPICGDGIVTFEEECDDGGVDDGDGCSGSCLVEAPCQRIHADMVFRPDTINNLPWLHNGRLNYDLSDPHTIMHNGLAIPALMGLPSCLSMSCGLSAFDKITKPFTTCATGRCNTSSDVTKCCDKIRDTDQQLDSSAKPFANMYEPCFSWKVGSQGRVPTPDQVISSCANASADGFTFAMFHGNNIEVRHDIPASPSTLQQALTESMSPTQVKKTAITNSLTSITFDFQKIGGAYRFGLVCAGSSEKPCLLWQVSLGADGPGNATMFASSQTGEIANLASSNKLFANRTFVIYRVPSIKNIWQCDVPLVPSCGDGRVSGSEECDTNSSGCSSTCHVIPGFTCCEHNGTCDNSCTVGYLSGSRCIACPAGKHRMPCRGKNCTATSCDACPIGKMQSDVGQSECFALPPLLASGGPYSIGESGSGHCQQSSDNLSFDACSKAAEQLSTVIRVNFSTSAQSPAGCMLSEGHTKMSWKSMAVTGANGFSGYSALCSACPTFMMMILMMMKIAKPYEYGDDTDDDNEHTNDSYTAAALGAAAAALDAAAALGAGAAHLLLRVLLFCLSLPLRVRSLWAWDTWNSEPEGLKLQDNKE